MGMRIYIYIYIYIDKGQLPKGVTYRLFLRLVDLVYIVCVCESCNQAYLSIFVVYLERVDHISDVCTVYSSVRNNDKINGACTPFISPSCLE